MFQNHNFKISWCNPNNRNFDNSKFVGKINVYISKLREKKQRMSWSRKLAEDFEKIVAFTKSKVLKRDVKNILPNYKK